MPDDAQVDPGRIIEELRRELDARIAERDEALAQQAAISEIVQIINRSGGDLTPVFDAMLDKALQLCEAAFGALLIHEGDDRHRAAAIRGLPPERADYWAHGPRYFGPGTSLHRLVRGERLVHMADAADDEGYRSGNPIRKELVEIDGARSWLAVPLCKDGVPLGAFAIYRREVRPFSDKQVTLLGSFAAQAVIAMENARLITETRDRTRDLQESLDYQTATSDVLKVISRSTFDLNPVLDTVAETAARLCSAEMGLISIRDGDVYRVAACFAVSREYEAFIRQQTFTPGRGTITGRAALERRAVQVVDFASDPELAVPEAATVGNIRTMLGVPLMRQGEPIGVIGVARQRVEPFTERQIELVRTFADQAVIAIENARLITETREALEQQTATAEVLQVINSSPGDLAPVFDAILEKALGLCEAKFGNITTYDGEAFHLAAAAGHPEFAEFLSRQAMRPSPVTGWGRIAAGEQFVHIVDLAAEQAYKDREPLRVATVELGGARTCIFVPLVKDNAILGVLTAYRQEVRPFTDKQIALLQSFTAQAVIAMENARLLTETREALEQQTATAEVLQVINSSPGDLAPVFDAMLGKAMRLCNAACGIICTYDGTLFHPGAARGSAGFVERVRKGGPFEAEAGFTFQRVVAGQRVVHIPDVLDTQAHREKVHLQAVAEISRARSLVTVALAKEDQLLGTITVFREEVSPYSEREIALLQNFAAQAVIAIENTRLITETREALEQQTATAEVLQVINSSPGDLAPVFDAILGKAHKLCGITFGSLQLRENGMFRAVAVRGVADSLAELLREPVEAVSGTPAARLADGERFVQIEDVAEVAKRQPDHRRANASAAHGLRTVLFVPLRKEAKLLGYITGYREEVRPFSEKEIALLENFAAQAVIAMENARLLTETREALDQQTATAEVLQAINSSPGDLAPVFDAMLEKATRLCGAHTGHLVRYENGALIRAASFGVPEEFDELFPLNAPMPDAMVRDSIPPRMIAGRSIIHVPDLREDESYRVGAPAEVAAVQAGIRTALYVPLIKDQEVVGAFITHRLEVRPFSEKQIALLQNFAAQAVIAMENARLITETREALEQQTATAEVLQVINSSPGDLAPVFDAMLEKATRLCEADFGVFWKYDGERFYPGALRGVPQAYADFAMREPLKFDPESGIGRIERGESLAHYADLPAEPVSRSGPLRTLHELGGIRSLVAVPLRKDAVLLGIFVVYRQEVRPFTDRQIALLQNFAAQAVIAIENARLITETREALEQQTATAEVLQVINSSPGDLAPVFDAMLEKAHSLCGIAYGSLQLYDGERFRAVAVHGYSESLVESLREGWSPSPKHPIRGLLDGAHYVHIRDLAEIDDPAARRVAELGGIRTALFVALRKDGTLLGMISSGREEIRPFSEKEIALLQNFAAQAVIAMENARLITETRERTRDLQESLEYQTATSDVLKVISRSTFDLQPVLDTLVQTAARLCNAGGAAIAVRQGDVYRYVATFSINPAWVAMLRDMPFTPSRDTVTGRALLERRVAHVADIAADPEHAVPQIVAVGGIRTLLAVPLLREGEPLGVLAVGHTRVEPFTDRQIELVRTFADQAVIAIENTRLITETREALAQQTATAEILEVINRSPGDLAPVFDAILEKAHSLCGAALGSLQLYDGESFRAVAIRGQLQAAAERLRQPRRPDPGSPAHPLVAGQRFVHVPDAADIDTPGMQNIVKLAGLRTVLYVALRKENTLLGFIGAGRDEVRLFSDKEIALLEGFAAEAVIAMDNARLLDEIRQRQAELRVTFDNMGDGVAMFDSDQRLAAWNLNFQRILELPDPLLAERPSYPDYIRFLAERGEFGIEGIAPELSRRLEATEEELRLERARPDGSIIEIRRNAVPGGGFVIIYGDVTERKRAESEIRAARDTAEKALQELQTASSQPVARSEDGGTRSINRGDRARDQEPAQLRQQFCRIVGRTAAGAEGNYGAGGGDARRRRACRGRRGRRDAARQPRQDRRARQAGRRHRQEHARTLAWGLGRAPGGRPQRADRGGAEPRLSRRPRPGCEL
jgi:GAF domain-containing protein